MPGLGNITTEHTVWCGSCDFWYQSQQVKIALVKTEARQDGWRFLKGKWVCPKCCAKKAKTR